MNDAPAGQPPRHPWWRRPRILIPTAIVAAAVVAGAVIVGPSEPRVQITTSAEAGAPAPTFALPSLTDATVVIDFADLTGTPIVLNFWASWCVPCRREMPALEAVHREYADRVTFVGVNHQDDRSNALDLIAATGVTYPSAYDPRGEIATRYNLIGMPTTVFITAEGRIAGRHTGELTEYALRAALDDVIGG